jgi:hypothetical protein
MLAVNPLNSTIAPSIAWSWTRKLVAQTLQFLPPGRRVWLYKEKISSEDFQPMVAGVDEALNPDTSIQILDRAPLITVVTRKSWLDNARSLCKRRSMELR